MTLREQQSLFVRLTARLIDHAHELGYELTYGETYRSPEEAKRLAKLGKGIAKSLHTDRLAVDFNLFKNGVWQRSSEAHRPLGEYWESLHPLCRWGGRFTDRKGRPKPDGNHYSMEFQGRQ